MRTATVPSSAFQKSGRLDAKYYVSPAVLAGIKIAQLQSRGVPLVPLGGENGIAKIWTPLRFKSILAGSAETRAPYLQPYAVFDYLPRATMHLSAQRVPNIDECRLVRGTILQTCSGRNLGPLTMVDACLAEFVVGADMIRIQIEDDSLRYYALAYLQTEIGQQLLKQGKTGSVIDHLSPKHVASQTIPLLDADLRDQVASKMKKAFELRERARVTMGRIQQEYLNALPVDNRIAFPRLGWASSSTEMPDRLDAAFYDRYVEYIRNELLKLGGPRLCDVARVEKPQGRYKTIYVGPEYGSPILSGTQLLQEYPVHLQYIAPKAFSDIKRYQLQRNWIVYQADGRAERGLGSAALVNSERAGWLASGHVGRLIAFPETNPGSLFLAFCTWHVQLQVKSKASGSVVDSTFPEDMESIILPPIGNLDGDLVVSLWEDFTAAKALEISARDQIASGIDAIAAEATPVS